MSIALLVFGGALLGLLIRTASDPLARKLRIPPVAAVCLTIAIAVAAIAGIAALLGSAIAAQAAQLRETLPPAVHDALQQLRASALGVWIAGNIPSTGAVLPDAEHLLTRATGLLSSAAGALIGVLVVIFVAVAGAFEPQLYASGFVMLFPAQYRARIRGVIAEIAATLRAWMVARLITMVATTILVTAGLTVLRIPLAGALGVIAGLLAFVPNIGAFVAALPALALAFVAGPRTLLAVAVMYAIVHVLDDFAVAPFVERRVVKLPPVLTLVAQLVLGLLAGALGVMLAAPIVAVAIVAVRRLWVEDVADRDSRKPRVA